ncbi:MAG TPA: hypothetical protein ENK52_06755 [Saprospiraceae bacterium]|nr:hypothetical protein [Saprospiraceae bacterium]
MSITYDEIIGVKKGTKNPEVGSTTSWLILYSIFHRFHRRLLLLNPFGISNWELLYQLNILWV